MSDTEYDLDYEGDNEIYRDDLLEWENDRVAEDVALEQVDYDDCVEDDAECADGFEREFEYPDYDYTITGEI